MRAEICQLCKGKCIALSDEERGIPKKPLSEQLLSAFTYPFREGGLAILIIGSLFFWIPFVNFFFGGYLSAYMLKVIKSSANGDEELPNWPDFSGVWDSIIRPALLVEGAFIFSFGPSFFYYFYYYAACLLQRDCPNQELITMLTDPLGLILIGFGLLYFPMGLLVVALFDSITALNPLVVVSSIAKIFSSYLVALGILSLAYLLGISASVLKFIPFLGSVLGIALSFYFLMVEMRILGLIYFANQQRLNWF